MVSRALLLAEDDDDHYLLFKLAWREAGLSVPISRVSDGEGVLEYLEHNSIPLLTVLDIKMPRKDGLETLAWIRERAQFKDMPVIMLSSSGHEVDIVAAKNLGANDYLIKPIGFEELVPLLCGLAQRWLPETNCTKKVEPGESAHENKTPQ